MPNPRYRKGYRNEKRARAFLENQGYLVTEARGSHGLWDLIGVHSQDGRVILAQVKTNKLPSKPALRAMRDFPRPIGGFKVLLVYWDRAAEPEVFSL